MTYLREVNLMVGTTTSKFVNRFEQPSALLVLKNILAEKRLCLRARGLLIRHLAKKIQSAKIKPEKVK